jgi:hypothetical protein
VVISKFVFLNRFFLKHLPEEMNSGERGWYSSLFRMLESRYPAVLDSQTRKMFAENDALKNSYHGESIKNFCMMHEICALSTLIIKLKIILYFDVLHPNG